MSLHRVCCCDVDTCADDWDFFDCCSGRRNYIDGGGTTQQASTMGVSLKRFYLPAGELVDSYGSGLIHITSFPRAAFMIGGQLNYGEPSPNNYDYFGAKAGNWPTPSSGSSGYAREIKLREFAQFGNNWDAGSWKTYSSTNVDEVLRGIHTPTATGTFDRLELSITGPVTCTSAGCRLLASSSLVLSSAAIAYEIACGAKWYRCTDTDGALDSSCDPVSGEYPACCEQCPQDLDVRISSLTRPQNYVFGNGCGVPADVQAAVEVTDPGFYTSHWWQGFLNSTGGTNYFGECVNGWHWTDCGAGPTSTTYGTGIREDATCTCCPYDIGNREAAITVLT